MNSVEWVEKEAKKRMKKNALKTVMRRRKPKERYGPGKSDGVREGQNK